MRTAFVLLFSVIMSLVFYRLGVFHRLEPAFSKLEVYFEETPESSEVVLVDITDEDYLTIFKGRSPLDSGQLNHLISAIASGKPAVIGVDIDTSSSQFKKFEIPDWWPPIVWEREIQGDPNDSPDDMVPLDVLGGRDPALNNTSGLALLIDTGEDNVTRQYQRLIKTKVGLLPSFPWAIVTRSNSEKAKQLRAGTEPLMIRYTGDRAASHRYRFTAARVLELYKEAGWKEKSPIEGKIVLLGGSYLLQDQHDTPLGRMSGMEVMAYVIETEMHGGGHSPPSILALVVLLFFEGFLVIFVFHHFSIIKATIISILALLVISSVISLIIYRSLSHLPYFSLIFLLVVIYQAIETYRSKSMDRAYQAVHELPD